MPAVSMPRTPEGRLIRRFRRQARLSIPAAAARAGISAEHWGNIERGYRTVSAAEREDVAGLADVIALMARAVGVPAALLESEGERPDAAAELRRAPAADGDAGADRAAAARVVFPGDPVAQAIVSQKGKAPETIRRELAKWLEQDSAARA